mgnify:CR=1 FL=1
MKKKKELLITLAGAAVLGGIIGAMSGCSNSYRVRTDPEIIGSVYEMGGKSSAADCCGNVEYSYNGFTDCFGLTVDDDTTADDIYMSYYICNGMYCVNMPVESGDSVVPVYGCYTAH